MTSFPFRFSFKYLINELLSGVDVGLKQLFLNCAEPVKQNSRQISVGVILDAAGAENLDEFEERMGGSGVLGEPFSEDLTINITISRDG